MSMIKNWKLAVALAAVVTVGAAPLRADMSEVRKAQVHAMALRAARLDGIRKLSERINGLLITSETHVKDFVAQSDTIQSAMSNWMVGMREVEAPTYNDFDGTCQIKMEVTLAQVITKLTEFYQMYGKGDRFHVKDIQQMTDTNKESVIQVVGVAASAADNSPADSSDFVPVQSKEDSSAMGPKAKQLWMETYPEMAKRGQARLMAVRAAELDGMRRLAERVYGLQITSNTTVRDFIAQSDEINTKAETFIQGARTVAVRYHDDELMVEAQVEMTLQQVYTTLKAWGEIHYKGDHVNVKKVEELSVQTKNTTFSEVGMGIPPFPEGDVKVSATVKMAAQSPEWVKKTIKATGNAAVDSRDDLQPQQAKLMALRAAELDARRKLAEQLRGLMISSNTSVKDFIAQSDQIDSTMMDFQQNARVIESSKKVVDGLAEATVELDLMPVWDTILEYQRIYKLQVK